METSRYRNTAAITQNGQTYLGVPGNTVYPPKGTDVFYDVEPEDTLHKIAYRFFGNSALWWVVARFNDVLDPFAELEPGTTLRLPNRARLWMEVLA